MEKDMLFFKTQMDEAKNQLLINYIKASKLDYAQVVEAILDYKEKKERQLEKEKEVKQALVENLK